METAVWEALPPRKRGNRGTKASLDGEGVDSAPSKEESVGVEGSDWRRKDAGARNQAIYDNIQARADKQWANATLDSKDGCAGEFYEYLDHTADVQCHSWGSTLVQAFENMAPCMFNYMTDLSMVEEDPEETIEFTTKGHDMNSLLFAYMDEMLFRFGSDCFCVKRVEVLELNRETFELKVKAHGDIFDRAKHVQGTEIKAITYSNMQIHETPEKADLYVIVDI